jgi:hypothetical protein
MSAGGRIFSQQNLIIMPVSLQQQTAQIMYSVDVNGQLSAIWLLTPPEAAKYKLSKRDEDDRKKLEDEARKKREAAQSSS